jgi:uncharacterized membrane protein YbhN (UPF0104 family)
LAVVSELPSPGRSRLTSTALWAGLAISAVFAYLALRHVHPDAVADALGAATWWWLVPALATLAAAVLLRALRWRLLFVPERRPPFRATLDSLLIGYFFNNVLPARAGEAARVVALRQRAGTSRVEAVGTIFTERVADLLVLLALLGLSLPFLPHVSWLHSAALLALALGALLLGAVAALALFGERPLRAALRPLAWLPWISVPRTEDAAENLAHGLAALRRPSLAAGAVALTAASWLLVAASSWAMLEAFDLHLGFWAALLVVIATNLVLVIPSSPGAVGVFESAAIVALGAWDVGRSRALSFALVYHALNLIPFLVVGWVVLHRHAATWRARDRPAAS